MYMNTAKMPYNTIKAFSLILILLTQLSCTKNVASNEGINITEVTQQWNFGGPTATDSLGGHGVMWGDANNDGWPDLYVTMNWKKNAYPDLYYENQKGGFFIEKAEQVGLADIDGGSHGAVWVDLDNDGDLDIVNGTTLALAGIPDNDIYVNQDGVFTKDTTTVLSKFGEATRGVVTPDLNNDGYADIFCVSGYKGSDDPVAENNELYINNGNGEFSATKQQHVLRLAAGQGAVDTDFDHDGDVDLIAGNKSGNLAILRNEFPLDSLSIVNPAAIGIHHTAYGGVTSGDVDNDGDTDLFLVKGVDGTPYNRSWLYVNDGKGNFRLQQTFDSIDGYMAGLADLDNDTDVDLVFDGHPFVYENDGTGNFVKGAAITVANIDDPRCVAFADMDKDGDLDFAFGVKRSINRLYRNDYKGKNRWLAVQLTSAAGQASAFGTKIWMYATDNTLLGYREAQSNHGYLAQDNAVLHFGCGTHNMVHLKIEDNFGHVYQIKEVATNQQMHLDLRKITSED